jgi:hypothetical protein
MVTVYTVNQDRLMAVHYCAAGNQPQLQTAPVTPAQRRFQFTFVRAANLRNIRDGHMSGLVLTIDGDDAFSEEWTWLEAGTSRKGLFRYTRIKNAG